MHRFLTLHTCDSHKNVAALGRPSAFRCVARDEQHDLSDLKPTAIITKAVYVCWICQDPIPQCVDEQNTWQPCTIHQRDTVTNTTQE